MADQANPGSVVAQPNNSNPTAGGDHNGGGAPNNPITVDPAMVEWAASKGVKDFDKKGATDPDFYRIATSYREAEKFLGGDKIAMPKDMNDTAALKTVFSKLGMPEKSDGYKLEVPGGQSTEFTESFKTAAHSANLTQSQAEGLNKWWNSQIDTMVQADNTRRSELAAADLVGLQKDWSGKFDENKEVATRAQNMLSSELGIPRDRLSEGLEEVFGVRDAMRILNFLGTKASVAGDTFEGGDHNSTRGGGPAMSSDDAKAEKERLLSDPKFAKDYRNKDASARARLANLNTLIAGTMPDTPPKVTVGAPGRR